MPTPIVDLDLPPHPLGPYVRGRGGRPGVVAPGTSVRGGSVYVRPSGYVAEHSPDHPKILPPSPGKSPRRQVLQHRLVMECMLGRLLEPDEIVHHRNRVRHDNRSANLELLDRRNHGLEHRDESREAQRASLTEQAARAALEGRSTREAAELLGVTHMTLRRWYPHLLTKRRSPGGAFPAEFVAQVREMAADPTTSTRKACELLGVTTLTLMACRRRHEIKWIAAPSGRPPKSSRAA